MLRSARFVVLLAGLFTFSSCAYLLYPERRGSRNSGVIDTVPLIIDIVWFLPGLIPGIICLAVDFSSGAIYVGGGGGTKFSVKRNGKVVVNRPPLEVETEARVAIVDGQGNVFAEERTLWSPEHPERKDKMKLQISSEARLAADAGTPLLLEVQLGDAEPTQFGLELAAG